MLDTGLGGVRESTELYKPMTGCAEEGGAARTQQEVTACVPGANCWGVSVVVFPKSSVCGGSVCVFTGKLQARLAGEQGSLGSGLAYQADL